MGKYIVVTEIRATLDVELQADSLEDAISKVKKYYKLSHFLKDEIIVNDGRVDVSGVLSQDVDYKPMK